MLLARLMDRHPATRGGERPGPWPTGKVLLDGVHSCICAAARTRATIGWAALSAYS